MSTPRVDAHPSAHPVVAGACCRYTVPTVSDLLVTRVRTELVREVATADGIRAKMEELRGLITSTEVGLDELQRRGFWKRVFANNTADLANAMRGVVGIQQLTFTLVVAMLQIHARNAQMLGVVRDQMLTLHDGLGRLGSSNADHAELQVAMSGTLSQLALIVDQHIVAAEREQRAMEREAELALRIKALEDAGPGNPSFAALWIAIAVLVVAVVALGVLVLRGAA